MASRDPFVRAAWAGWVALALALLVVPAACHEARAQAGMRPDGSIQLSPNGCTNFGGFVEQAADARDAGVQLRAYSRYLARRLNRQEGTPSALAAILQRELREIWASKDDGSTLAAQAYTRCMAGPLSANDL